MQQQKPKQLTLFQAGFKKDEVTHWAVPSVPGPSRAAHPPMPAPAPATASTSHQDSDVILIDDDEDDLLLAQALDQTMSECVNTAPPPAAAAGTPLEVLPGFDAGAGTSWVYPVNYPVREYQYNIVRAAIFENTLVSLPTGLGKTFIAAVLMYNYYRWYPRGKVVFLAPTRPLVAQQIDACYRIMGISREDTAELTGSMSPTDRRSRWLDRRVFFLTPQVLNNDLTTGSCPAELLRCVVIDEAHKALGNHAYCQVVRELRRHTQQFRVLALSATPGSDLKAVTQVLSNLLISRVEVRSEECADVTPYTHGRLLEKVVVPLGDGLSAVRDKYMQVVRTFASRLIQLKVVYTRDETTLTKFALLKARDAFKQAPPAGISGQRMGLVESDFAMCMSLYHALELLQLHGLRSFHSFVQSILRGEKGSARGRAELMRHPVFNELMTELEQTYGLRADQDTGGGDGGEPGDQQVAVPAVPAADLVRSHPKLARLKDLVEQHFRDCGDTTRVMVFSQYRESVLEISAVLQQLQPTVRAMHFIGQSTGRSSRGFSQKEQLKVIAAFRNGGFNTLVSTCVGEEGLDIGDVDLIVCYDVSKSPISLVQRMGRTGRKRHGRIVVLVTEGKEDRVYNQSMYQRKSILKTIMSGTKLAAHLFKDSPRMVPRGLNPVCHRLYMTVAPSSPATTGRGRGRGRGGAARGRGGTVKVNVKSGETVRGGARGRGSTASGGGRGRGSRGGRGAGRMGAMLAALAPDRGPATAAYLDDDELREWDARYKLRPSDGPLRRLVRPRQPAGGGAPSAAVTSLHEWLPWQTTLQPTHVVTHSDVSRNLVRLLAFMSAQAETGADAYEQEMLAIRRREGIEEDELPAAPSVAPPPQPARPASPAAAAPAADVSLLTESEQVAEAIRLSLLETSGRDSPPPLPPEAEPDWPPVASPPGEFTGWGDGAGLLAALEQAIAMPLVSAAEGVLMLRAENAELGAETYGGQRLEHRVWLEAKRQGPEQRERISWSPGRGAETEGDKCASPGVPGVRRTDVVDGVESNQKTSERRLNVGDGPVERDVGRSSTTVLNRPREPDPAFEPDPSPPAAPADRPVTPTAGPGSGDAIWDDWNADWEWNMTPPAPVTPPPAPVTPPPACSVAAPSPAGGLPPSPAAVAAAFDVADARPPFAVSPLAADDDGSPILPSQNPSKRRRLSRRGNRRKLDVPDAAPSLAGVVERLDSPAPVVATGVPSPPPPLPPPVLTLQAGLRRRPSSEDLFGDESLFARVDEPPPFVDDPAASLGFEPTPVLARPGSTSAANSGTEAAAQPQRNGVRVADKGEGRERMVMVAPASDGGRRRSDHADSALEPKRPLQASVNNQQTRNYIGSEGAGLAKTDAVAAAPAPYEQQPPSTARRRHPSSQPLFDFGFDDDALFANVVTPPQPPEPPQPPFEPLKPQPVPPQSPELPQPLQPLLEPSRTLQSLPPEPRTPAGPLPRHLTAGPAAVSSPLRSTPLLSRLAPSVRDSPVPGGASLYSTTQLLDLVDQSVLSSGGGGRTPVGPRRGASRTVAGSVTPAARDGRLDGRRDGRRDGVGRNRRRGEAGETSVTPPNRPAAKVVSAPPPPRAAPASPLDRPVFDLFANFFEDSDLFEGVSSRPTDPADPRQPAQQQQQQQQAAPEDVVDLTDSPECTVVERAAGSGADQTPGPPPRKSEALFPAGEPGTPSVITVSDTSRENVVTPTAAAASAAGATIESPLFTVTRPRPQPQTPASTLPPAVAASPAVSPILSSQRRPREAVSRRHSTPLSARRPRRLSTTKPRQRHSTPIAPAATAAPAAVPASVAASSVAPAAAAAAAVVDVPGLTDEDLWTESAFETPRRPAARALRLDSGAARRSAAVPVPESPLARPVSHSPVRAPTGGRPVSATESNAPDRSRDGTPLRRLSEPNAHSDTAAVQPAPRTSATPQRATPQMCPMMVLSRVSGSGTGHAADETGSPVARPPAGRRRLRPGLLVDTDDETPLADGTAADGRRQLTSHPESSRSHSDSRSHAESVIKVRSHEESSRSHSESTEKSRNNGESVESVEEFAVTRRRSDRDSSSESVIRRPAPAGEKRRRRRARNPFLDDEADLSASDAAGSSDEESGGPDSDAYDQSMIDDAPEPTQADVDMRAVYLKSVRSPGRAAPGFRRPALPRPTDSELFSQVPQQDDDYEQDSFCVDSDHVEYASSGVSADGESLAAVRQRGRRRRIVTQLSSSDGEHSPARRDARATVRRDTSATRRPPSGSESDADFQIMDRSEVIPRRPEPWPRVKTKTANGQNSSSTNGVWLSSKRPAVSPPKSVSKAKRRPAHDDPFESDKSVTKNKRRSPPDSALPVFDLGLFDSDDDGPIVAPLSEIKQNTACDPAERARQARLERARLKQAECRRRLTEGRPAAADGSADGSETSDNRSGERPGPSTVQAETGPLCVIASSREVSCAPRVLSDLRAVHRLRTEVRSLPAEDYVISRRAAVVRRPAADLLTAPGRRRLSERLRRTSRLYARRWLLLEKERPRPGAAPQPTEPQRCRPADALLAQLARAGVSILHSDSPEDSASLLARLAAAERQAGWCLPPPPPEAPASPIEDARRRLLESLPGVSVPLVADVRRQYGTLAQFLQSSPGEMELRLGGAISHERAAELCQALRWQFPRS